MINQLTLPNSYIHLVGLGTASAGLATGIALSSVVANYLPVTRVEITTQDRLSFHKVSFRMGVASVPLVSLAAGGLAAVSAKLPGEFALNTDKGLIGIAAAIAAATVPWTLFTLRPINRELTKLDAQPTASRNLTRGAELIDSWEFSHLVRSAALGLSFALSMHALLF